MKKYLVLYKSSTPAKEMMANASPEQMQAGMEDWRRWSTRVGDAIVDLGSRRRRGERRTRFRIAWRPEVTGFSIVQADSLDAATQLLVDHPHLKTPGQSSITAIELLPAPGM